MYIYFGKTIWGQILQGKASQCSVLFDALNQEPRTQNVFVFGMSGSMQGIHHCSGALLTFMCTIMLSSEVKSCAKETEVIKLLLHLTNSKLLFCQGFPVTPCTSEYAEYVLHCYKEFIVIFHNIIQHKKTKKIGKMEKTVRIEV